MLTCYTTEPSDPGEQNIALGTLDPISRLCPDDLPCRVQDPDLWFAETPGELEFLSTELCSDARASQEVLRTVPGPGPLPSRCHRATRTVGCLGRPDFRTRRDHRAQASPGTSAQDRSGDCRMNDDCKDLGPVTA